jgi:hypothetical protein
MLIFHIVFHYRKRKNIIFFLVKPAMYKLHGFIDMPQFIPCSGHFKLHIRFHSERYSNLLASNQAFLPVSGVIRRKDLKSSSTV